MNRRTLFLSILCLSLVFSMMASAQQYPVFKLAWSEYPSWSVFGVARNANVGLINEKQGAPYGTVEEEFKVDIVLNGTDYDTCMVQFGSGAVDAVCITNTDIPSKCISMKSVAIMPTSTSYHADAVIVNKTVADVDALRSVTVHGLEQSVSQYVFDRCLIKLGKNPDDYKFENLDPAAAATQMQLGQERAIIVWNPFVLDTLQKRKDSRVLFDSSLIPGEVIDMVVASQAALKRPGGENFAKAVCRAYYLVNKRLLNPDTRDKTLIAIGSDFSKLGLADMRKVVQQTIFFPTPEMGIACFNGGKVFPFQDGLTDATMKDVMPLVIDWSKKRGLMDKDITIAYGKGDADLVFDWSYMQAVQK